MRSLLLVATALAAAVAAPPPSWVPKIQALDMLYTDDDSNVVASNMPEIGNGFVATQIDDTSIWVAGVFNGYLTQTPSHRARVPSSVAISIVGGTVGHAALDVREATYFRRTAIAPSAPGACVAGSNVTCTNSNSTVWVEQRWYAHRALPHLLAMELEVLVDGDEVAGSADAPFLVLALAQNSGLPSIDILFLPVHSFPTYAVYNGSTLVAETNTSALTAVCVLSDVVPPTLEFPAPPSPGAATTAFFTVVRTSLDTPASQLVDAVESEYLQLRSNFSADPTALRAAHVAAWSLLWQAGFEVAGRPDVALAVNTSFYSILSSTRPDWPFSLSPGGLTAGYNGHTFWDCETWMFPAILLFFPDVASSLLEYRQLRLAGAEAKAQSYQGQNYTGAMFPWESAFTGEETCPTWAATGLREIHISGDIAVAVWQFHRMTQDPSNAWLQSVGYPLLSGIADFWASKATIDTARALLRDHIGAPATEWNNTESASMRALRARLQSAADLTPLHINDVIPPDEYHDHCNDSAYTNAVAKLSLDFAVAAAQLLNRSASEYAAWLAVQPRIPIPFDPVQQIHPEFVSYQNDTIKQADVILLGYPLDISGFGNMTPQVRANDLFFYDNRTDPNGPAMTWSMTAVGFVELNELETASAFFNRSFANAQAPFDVWTETPTGGTPNFLTGAGGFLQGAIMGYSGLRTTDAGLVFRPVLHDGASRVVLRNFAYLGNPVSLEYDAKVATFSIPASFVDPFAPSSATSGAAFSIRGRPLAPQSLSVRDASGVEHPLAPGAAVTLPVGQTMVLHGPQSARGGPLSK